MLLAAAATLVLGSKAHADEPEPLLFLGIQRSTTIDKLASQIIIEHLRERGENLLQVPGLSDTDRRCRRMQCLAPIAVQRKAVLVLDGDVQQVGANRTLRIVMHLYDSRKRQQQELENLCSDCDETKLGIMLTNTTTDLLGQYHKTAVAMDQLAALLDATPVTVQDRTQAAGPSATRAAFGTLAAGQAPGAPAVAVPNQAQTPPGPVGAAADAARQVPIGDPAAPAPYPLPASALPPGGPAAYPTPLPPPPMFDPIPPLQSRPARGLSTKRKAIAGVFGVIGAGSLVAAIVLNILDQKIASNNSYNPGGSPCVDPQYAGQSCVYSTIRLWAPGYGFGALMLGGMILTLTVPEREPR